VPVRFHLGQMDGPTNGWTGKTHSAAAYDSPTIWSVRYDEL